jgi:hypothetical protein
MERFFCSGEGDLINYMQNALRISAHLIAHGIGVVGIGLGKDARGQMKV